MIYIFPAVKFTKTNTQWEQMQHAMSEFYEVMKTIEVPSCVYENKITTETHEEAMDLYHSLETLFRIWERDGVDMEAVQRKVFEKNRRRGYYEGL